jgi:ubiquitin-conjugating enzyme E2 D/E
MSNSNRIDRDIKDVVLESKSKEVIVNVDVNSSSLLGPHYITIKGPQKTPYQDGLFKLSVKFNQEYPYKAPEIVFLTKIYHPNINSSGIICLDILKDQWSAALRLHKVILSISSLIDNPNPDDPLFPEAANKYKADRDGFNEIVREYVDKYAKPKHTDEYKLPIDIVE